MLPIPMIVTQSYQTPIKRIWRGAASTNFSVLTNLMSINLFTTIALNLFLLR